MQKILIFLILFYSSIYSQWQPDMRLSTDPGASSTSMNNSWCIASNGNLVHVVWQDNRDGNNEIYYKGSTNGGINWITDTRMTNNPANSGNPSVSLSGSDVHIVWHDSRDGNSEIYYKRSTDGGSSWGPDTRITNNVQSSAYPSISSTGSAVHVVWVDFRNGREQTFYKHSTDRGLNWGTDTLLSDSYYNAWFPSVSASGSAVHVAWGNMSGPYRIFYRRSSNGGSSWGENTQLTTLNSSSYPSISASDTFVHLVWRDLRDSNNEIYYKRSTNAGLDWEPDTRLTNDTAASQYPNIFASGYMVHVAWYDVRDGNNEIYYKRSTNNGGAWENDVRLTNNAGSSKSPSVTASGPIAHVIWSDDRDGNYEIYYKRNPTGNVVGIKNISSVEPGEYKFYQNYPNPFNPSTKIKFDIPTALSSIGEGLRVRLVIYDILGREIAVLVNEQLRPGTYEVEFNAWANGNSSLPSGVYFYRLTAGDPSAGLGQGFAETKKMILLK